MDEKLAKTAAQILGCDEDDIFEEKWTHYGLDVFSYGGQEYAIGNDEACDEACKELIQQSIWAFSASFILNHSKVGYSVKIEKCLQKMQEALSEDCNELMEALIQDMDSFVRDAISSDGRGNFLSSYDGEEQEIVIDGDYFYAYRQN